MHLLGRLCSRSGCSNGFSNWPRGWCFPARKRPSRDEPLRMETRALPLLKRSAEGLQQVIRVSVENRERGGGQAEVVWHCANSSGSLKFERRFGHNEVEVLTPEVNGGRPSSLCSRPAAANSRPAPRWRPTRKWRMFIVPTVHTDVGYTDLQDALARHAEQHRCRRWHCWTSTRPSTGTWKPIGSSTLPARPSREDRGGVPPPARGPNGAVGFLRQHAHRPLLARGARTAPRSTPAISPTRAASTFRPSSSMTCPAPSAACPRCWPVAGIQYFIEGVNGERAPHATQGLQNPFLLGRPGRLARAGPHCPRLRGGQRPDFLPGPGRRSACPALLARLRERRLSLRRSAGQRRLRRQPGHRALDGGGGREVERAVGVSQAHPGPPGGFLPLHRAELRRQDTRRARPTSAGGGKTARRSSAHETALCRRAEERAVTAEMLHSLAAVLGGEPYPKWSFDELWRNILLYDEHTWGAAGSISRADRRADRQAVGSERLLRPQGRRRFAPAARSRHGQAGGAWLPAADLVGVQSACLVLRTDLVMTDQHRRRAGREDQERTIPCQALPEGGSCFVASRLALRRLPLLPQRRRAPADLADCRLVLERPDGERVLPRHPRPQPRRA